MQERVWSEYVVVYDGKATHHCATLDEARAFAESTAENDELGVFEGQNPVRIDKVTRITATETVFTFGEQDEPDEHADFPRPFYTVPQAAEALQVHENTIYRQVRSGKLEHYMVGKQIRIAASELARLKVERAS